MTTIILVIAATHANLASRSHELEEQSATTPGEAGASTGDADVLAWEPATEEIRTAGV
jgi:hypothetical protein